MNRKWIGLAGSIASVLILAAAAYALEADFDPSLYNPSVSEIVSFEVCESCLDGGGFRYTWDFDGDGAPEQETEDALVSHAFPSAGYYEVVLTVRSTTSGWTSTRRKGILVGSQPAYAVRELLAQSDGSILVLVAVTASADCSAVGFQEMMPQGWQMEVVDAGGATTRMNALEKKLEVVWLMQLSAGDQLTFSYRLYPGYSSTLRALSGQLSGYTEDGRFVGQISGELGMSQ